jgi:Zn-dependent peptidase ImmA (M78 family)
MDRAAEIEDLAELVAEEHVRSGQVDPGEIAKASSITFNFGHYDDLFDGYLECKARRFHIYINLDSNKAAASPRARFSFAHELGHYFLDWHRAALEHGAPSHGSRADFESDAHVEREADLFASNLLLPREKMKKAAARHIDLEEVRRLAASFGTSLSATAIRCAKLDLSPLIVMRWTTAGRAWCWSSPAFAQRTGNKAFRGVDRIPNDSATRIVLNGTEPEGRVCRRGTTLSTWFPSIRSGCSDDVILLEECASLGPHGTLTLLRPDR